MQTLIKRFILLTFSIVLMLTSFSCKKCSHCVEKDNAGNVQYDYGEFCGKKEEMESYEKQVKALVDPGNTIECSH